MNNLGRAYDIIWGQCTAQMRAKVESMNAYETVHNGSDVLGLLNLIKLAAFGFHTNRSTYIAVIEVEKAFKNFRQSRTMSCEDYHEKFVSLS